jgi:hypothetical protein
MGHTVIKIRKNLKLSQDRQKCYGDRKRTHKELVGYHVYIRVKPKRISLKMGTCDKLEPHYYGPFEVLERAGPIVYKLASPLIVIAHNVFHISLLKKYIHDSIMLLIGL